MLKGKRVCSLLLVVILFLTPICGYAKEVNGDLASETDLYRNDLLNELGASEGDAVENTDISINHVSEHVSSQDGQDRRLYTQTGTLLDSNARFSLGTVGYYIINGANMVSDGIRTIYGLENGICVQEGTGEEYFLCEDKARNLNIDDGKLYYTTTQNGIDYIKIIDIEEKVLEKSFKLPDFHIKHLYLMSSRYLVFSCEGMIHFLDLETEETGLYREYKDIFSFIPTRYGILYAKGALFDYTLYAEENKIVEHVSDYYQEGDILVYTLNGVEYRLEIPGIFASDFGPVDIEKMYTDESIYDTISVEEFQRQMREIIPTEYEEESLEGIKTVLMESTCADEKIVTIQGTKPNMRTTNSGIETTSILTPAKITDSQKAIKARAEAIYNDVWTTLGTVRQWSSEGAGKYISENTEIHGIIYGQPVNNGTFVLDPNGMSWEDYKKQRASVDSKLYSTNQSDWGWGETKENGKKVVKYGPKYACDCSTFASYCWDLESRHTTEYIVNYGIKINADARDFLGLQVGDIVNKKNDHVVVIVGVEYDVDGNIGKIETIEQTVPDVKLRSYSSYSEFINRTTIDSSGNKKLVFAGYYLYRSKTVESADTLTLSRTSHTLYAKDTFQLTATASPGGKITWKSTKPAIASVDRNGLVTANKAGKTTIKVTLTSDGAKPLEATCEVTVLPRTLTVKGVTKTVYIGERVKWNAEASPQTPILWYSDKPSVAIVQNGTITGLNPGSATITAAAHGIKRSYVVNVMARKISLDKTSLTLHRGETQTITAKTTPAAPVQWSSSNDKVATVDNTGKITAVKNGTAKIIASAENGANKTVTKTCTVTVKTPTVKLNKTKLTVYIGQPYAQTLTATPRPQADVTWSSSKREVAFVDNTGKITGFKAGTTKITASANGAKAVCTVTVKEPTFKIGTIKTSVYRGNSTTVKGTPTPTAEIVWKSADLSIATVDNNGKITGVKKGTTTITATAHGISKNCIVTVKEPIFRIDKTKLGVYPGTTGTIKATPTPKATVQWSSSDTGIARVDNKGKVTGVKAGTATITATAHGIQKTCTVTVKDPTFQIDQTSMTVYKGYTKTIKGSPTPNTTIQWSSSNTQIATVNNSGKVTGVKAGTATITATAHGIKRTCKVTVEDPTFQINQSSMILYRGYKGTITATPVPDTAVKWSSSNNKVATVSSTGKVTAIKAGTATITATAHGIKRTCTVTVKEPKLSVSVPSNTLRIGQSANLRVTVEPIAPVTYRSLNPNIVEVSPKGCMTAKSPGTTKIAVSANNLTKYVIIYVK